MTDSIALTGVVATAPRHITTSEGLDITSFRLASSQRRFDKNRQTWVDMGTNWYTVTAFRQLASNLAVSVQKGDRVVTAGRIRIREWENGEKSGTTIEIEAETVGHDLAWGNSLFTKSLSESVPSSSMSERAPVSQSAASRPADSWAVPGISGDAFLPDDEADPGEGSADSEVSSNTAPLDSSGR
ncbi:MULTISPECIES: single-stranded DNA-binding protein [Subtercola]|uniref:Single-stranded DNA-binding protein n=1 Tax=Subtercola vilae TaxID=2056433 RepID=A0A4T2C7P3_9MICO|nr:MULTISPECIES: single-stranded DNA-binding protein [Subtercola]MEA9986211.1 single-stranded DNA-binding protein [Subtercola sp. RTI3]TIH38328.1 single-stranded DNA-binding protein [Subtercola vilae]